MLLVFMLATILSIIMIKINSLISYKSLVDREKMSPFECGYDPKSMSRIPFSLHFYLLAMVFLIFDVEITIIIPMPVIFNMLNPWTWVITCLGFIVILLAGAIHEWMEGSLDWTK